MDFQQGPRKTAVVVCGSNSWSPNFSTPVAYLPTQIRFLIGGEHVTWHGSKLTTSLERVHCSCKLSPLQNTHALIRLVGTSLRSAPALCFLCENTMGFSPHNKFPSVCRPLLYNTYMSSCIVCSNDSVF